MTLSRKYYKELARILGQGENREDIKNKMEEYLKQDNPRFNVDKFEEAISKERRVASMSSIKEMRK